MLVNAQPSKPKCNKWSSVHLFMTTAYSVSGHCSLPSTRALALSWEAVNFHGFHQSASAAILRILMMFWHIIGALRWHGKGHGCGRATSLISPFSIPPTLGVTTGSRSHWEIRGSGEGQFSFSFSWCYSSHDTRLCSVFLPLDGAPHSCRSSSTHLA